MEPQNIEAKKYLDALREIDTHIRCCKTPIPYIVETLKQVLPEYIDPEEQRQDSTFHQHHGKR